MSGFTRHKADFFVGLFVLIAAIGIILVALRAANIADIVVDDGYKVQIHFDNIGSLVERAPVKSSGVRVGRVVKIAYDDEDHVAIVDIVIDSRFYFPTDSLFSVVSSNLLGGQYIAVSVGSEDEMLQDQDVVQGESAIILEELISKFLFEKAGE